MALAVSRVLNKNFEDLFGRPSDHAKLIEGIREASDETLALAMGGCATRQH